MKLFLSEVSACTVRRHFRGGHRRLLVAVGAFSLMAMTSFVPIYAVGAVPANELDFFEHHCQREFLTEKGVARIRTYLEKHPEEPRAHYVAGLMFDTLGMQSLAAEQFKAADKLSANYTLDKLHNGLRSSDGDSLRLVPYLSSRYPADAGVLYAQALMAAKTHQLPKAEGYLRKAVACPSPWPGSCGALSLLLYEQGHLKDSLAYAQRELSSDPSNSPALKAKTLSLIETANGTTVQHQKALIELAKLLPKDPTIHLYLADAFAKQGDFRQALAPAIIAAGWAENRTQLHAGGALLKALLMRLPETEVRQALDTLSPRGQANLMNALLRLRVADIYASLGNHNAAIRQLLESLEMSMVLAPRINFRLSQEYLTQSDLKLAAYFAAVAHKLRPSDDEIYRHLQRCEALSQNSGNDIARRLKVIMRNASSPSSDVKPSTPTSR